MPGPITAKVVFDAIVAGCPAAEVEALLQILQEHEQQAVVCTACYILDEVAANCQERAQEISDVVARHCHRYSTERKVCYRPD